MQAERHDRPDGSYSLIVYMDMESFAAVPKERATDAIISEYNAEGVMVMETVGFIKEEK
jgi:hypothetical protein